jgi:uncharacterized protein involved in exopolysaccharide biosynthesis
MAQDVTLDLKHYLRMLWRRRGVILLASVTVICSALVGVQFVPLEYESSTTIRIEERRRLTRELEQVLGPSGGGGYGYRADEARLDEMAARINNRPFLERVARLLKMNEDPRVLETARKALRRFPDATVDELAIRHVVNQLRRKVMFRRAGMSNYRIVVADSDPKNAQTLAKWISELFVDYSLQSSLEDLRTAHEFGAEQERIYEERLRLSEAALEQYRKAAIQTDLSQGFVREQNLGRAEALYTQVLDEVDLSRLRLLPLSRSIAEAGLSEAAEMIDSDPEVRSQAQAVRAELRETVTSIVGSGGGRGGPEWPPGDEYLVVRRGMFRLIERRTAVVHGARSAEVRDLISRFIFAKVDNEEQADVTAWLGRAIGEFKLQAQALPRDEMELRRLEADVSTNRTLLQSFRAQLISSDISQAMEVTNLGMRVEILDPPQMPLRPARPDKGKIIFAAIALGPLLGVGLGFVTELLDPTLRTLSDFQRVFDGPVLGTAPLLAKAKSPGRGLRRHWVTAAVTGVVLLTALFFLTRTTLLPDFTTVAPSIQVIDPGSEITP